MTGALSENARRSRASVAYADSTEKTDQRIVQYLPLVRHVAARIRSQLSGRLDLEELISAGTLGLVKAARNYDASKDADFKTYAYIRIRGAILDELRSRSFMPSGAYKQVQAIQEAYQRFADVNGRPPGDEELADEVGITTEQLYRSLQEARRLNFLSIHGLSEDSPSIAPLIPIDANPGPDEVAEHNEQLEQLAQAIMDLPQRDRRLLMLYYQRDLTMKETAEVLGVTEGRISQLHAAALFKLSMRLKGET